MSEAQLKTHPGYEWIIVDKRILGGTPTVKNTRLPVELVLKCLSSGMSADDIDRDYGHFPKQCIPEVLKFAAELAGKFKNVAA